MSSSIDYLKETMGAQERGLYGRIGDLVDVQDGGKRYKVKSSDLMEQGRVKIDSSLVRRRKGTKKRVLSIHPTILLPLLNLIDMFAVSLVVPLLFQYFMAAGITSANQRELLSSLFSSAQIVGGLLMGVLTDANIVERRTILFLSFGGSALSYALIVYGGLPALMVSRVLVGLVKQTMTVTTTMLTNCTTKETRAKHMGRLTAASTVAWIVGPSAGALLFKYVDHRVPALLACALFCLNMILAVLLIGSDYEEVHMEQEYNENDEEDEKKSSKKKDISVLSNIRSCFTSKVLGSVVIAQLILTWVTKATSYSQLGSFYEDMYDLEPHHRGYISSYQQLLQFVVQATLVGPVMNVTGGERSTACVFAGVLSAAVFLESRRLLWLFLIVLCPIISLSFSMMNLSLQTLITHVAPSNSVFSVLAALDVLQNAVSVSVPFYRTFLFGFMPKDADSSAMQGDPDPVSWVLASSLHWILAAVAMSYLLLSNRKLWSDESPKRKGR